MSTSFPGYTLSCDTSCDVTEIVDVVLQQCLYHKSSSKNQNQTPPAVPGVANMEDFYTVCIMRVSL